jgi:hypothetical protein
MISTVNIVSAGIVSALSLGGLGQRKTDHSALVCAVSLAIEREGLIYVGS